MVIKNEKGEIKTLKHNEIIKLLPHRFPFLLIDKVTNINLNKSITGIKEYLLMNHFLLVIFLKTQLCQEY